ncbi:DUF742 domain-containing protein [Streptomyces sp. CNQ085]|uniref:DUF742 domain-containing protein n=1 Tax=Streptomyces sp. CNQ085 TaxID=2886944 RepID=UPI001F511C27|nr:DUF742 domain-containing protein [Streptomyces sp. CNQ085]MCI0384160.1 DUF742 domain-containing protein [Streptomyces sp. CNQ085]
MSTEDPAFEATGRLVRPYVITGGREIPSEREFSVTTLIMAADDATDRWVVSPESRSVLELCVGGYLSVIEIAGHLGLPLGIVRGLLAELAENGMILTRAPVPSAERVPRQLLEDVLHGLRARFA